MLFPIVGFEFDVRNCLECDYFKARRSPTQSNPRAY
jgi:hypothetical protein